MGMTTEFNLLLKWLSTWLIKAPREAYADVMFIPDVTL